MRSLLFPALVVLVVAPGCFCQSREEKLKAAEDQGNLLVATKSKLLKGAGEALKKEGKEAVETVTEGTSELVKGIGEGVEKGLKAVKVKLDESVAANGIGLTRAARGEDGTKAHTVTAYVTFEKESGAHYVDFTFDERTPLLTAAWVQLRVTPKAP